MRKLEIKSVLKYYYLLSQPLTMVIFGLTTKKELVHTASALKETEKTAINTFHIKT